MRAGVVTEGIYNDYVDLRTSGPEWEDFVACLRKLGAALSRDEVARQWLASTQGFDALQDVFQNPDRYFAVAAKFLLKNGSVDSETEASTDDVRGYRAIFNHSLFSINSAVYNWDTIIHELAHILDCEDFRQHDGGDDAESVEAQSWNAELLGKHCGQVIRNAVR